MSQSKVKKFEIKQFFKVLLIVILFILVTTASTLGFLIHKGKRSAIGDNEIHIIDEMPEGYQIDSETGEDAYFVYHNGKKYKYNEKVTTILFAGIDKHSDEHIEGVYGTGGQADTILVMSLNTETGKYRLFAVSRDTMAQVNVFDKTGDYKGTKEQQICLSYAYFDGGVQSVENLKRSVSRLFFGMPVNAYAAIDLDAIPILNDQVGGVTVTVPEDLSARDPSLTLGTTLTLDGKQAETFVRARDVKGDENQNNLRMERQKVYLTSFIKQTLQKTKEKKTFPLQMYKSISDYLETDIDVSMLTYYTSIFLKSGFSSEDNMVKVPGTTVAGEKYAEYYTDTDAFFDMILNIYYTEVE